MQVSLVPDACFFFRFTDFPTVDSHNSTNNKLPYTTHHLNTFHYITSLLCYTFSTCTTSEHLSCLTGLHAALTRWSILLLSGIPGGRNGRESVTDAPFTECYIDCTSLHHVAVRFPQQRAAWKAVNAA